MALASRGHHYQSVHVADDRAHLGDVYHHEPSAEERALNALLESFSYPRMYDRKDALAEAHEGTFDWTFLEVVTQFLQKRNGYATSSEFQIVDMDFKPWLQDTDRSLFCVVYKPGSGKSEFMKSLAVNGESTQTLQGWADADVLLRADHFFWLLGPTIQKSVEGLLRRVKSFFLIDGLDECEPQDKLGDLATVILWKSQLPNVKLCVSLRPWGVFTRKLEHASVLHLDQVTCRDMKTYVSDQFTSVEEEMDRYSDFRNQTQSAKQLINKITHDAEVVFLWVALVTKAICSELRKGKRADRLNHIICEFPTDLDDYFNKLIFNRIGKSQQNIKDTAAALKLAAEVSYFENGPYKSTRRAARSPFSFSFTGIDHMLNQTSSFLEETCKDPLVLRRGIHGAVEFLHRKVFDFLTDKRVNDALEENAPDHFSHEDFITNLTKLRCQLILRKDVTEPDPFSSTLKHIVYVYQELTHLDVHAPWLLACEALSIAQMRECLLSGGPIGYASFSSDFVLALKAGLNQWTLEVLKSMPCTDIMGGKYCHNALGALLQATNDLAIIRSPRVVLIRQFLEFGSDPNLRAGKWPYERINRYPFHEPYDSEEEVWWVEPTDSCNRTTWEAWLGEAYLQLQRAAKIASVQVQETLDAQQQWIGAIFDLLLRYGADPRCKLCITDHVEKHYDGDDENCNRVDLVGLMVHMVPAESMIHLQNLRNMCSETGVSRALRRNQQRRAMRSLLISEQNFSPGPFSLDLGFTENDLWTRFLAGLTGTTFAMHSNCTQCSTYREAALARWCLERQALAYLCLECSQLRPSEVPDPVTRCTNSTNPSATTDWDHTSVTFLWQAASFSFTEREQPTKDYADLLRARYSVSQAIAVLKEWYAKNPIEPDLTFEETKHGMTTFSPSSERHRTSEDDDDAAGKTSAEVHAKDATNGPEIAPRTSEAPANTTRRITDPSQPEQVPKRFLRARLKPRFLS